MNMMEDEYRDTLSEYYDMNASMGYETRSEENSILRSMREDFRSFVVKYPFNTALEIGCGPGFDLVWFANKFPESELYEIGRAHV